MNKPLSNLTFSIFAIFFLILGSSFLYLDYKNFELNKSRIICSHTMTVEQLDENKTGFFKNMYIKTKSYF